MIEIENSRYKNYVFKVKDLVEKQGIEKGPLSIFDNDDSKKLIKNLLSDKSKNLFVNNLA